MRYSNLKNNKTSFKKSNKDKKHKVKIDQFGIAYMVASNQIKKLYKSKIRLIIFEYLFQDYVYKFLFKKIV